MRLFRVEVDPYQLDPPNLRLVAAKVVWFGRGDPGRPHRTGIQDLSRSTRDEREIDEFTDDAVRWIYSFGSSLADRAVWDGKPVYVGGVTVGSLADRYDEPWAIPYSLAPEILRMLAPGTRVPAGPIGSYPKVCRALIREQQLFVPFIANVLQIWIQDGSAVAARAAA